MIVRCVTSIFVDHEQQNYCEFEKIFEDIPLALRRGKRNIRIRVQVYIQQEELAHQSCVYRYKNYSKGEQNCVVCRKAFIFVVSSFVTGANLWCNLRLKRRHVQDCNFQQHDERQSFQTVR